MEFIVLQKKITVPQLKENQEERTIKNYQTRIHVPLKTK